MPAGSPTPEELQNMPLEQLEQLVMQEAARVQALLPGAGGEGEAAMGLPPGMPEAGRLPEIPGMEAPIEELPPPGMEAALPYMETGAPLDMLSADIIQQATTKLVEGGFLDLAASALTPELIQIFQSVAERVAPGIYDLTNDSDLMEFVNGIANGTVPLPSTRDIIAGAEAGPPAGAAPELGGPEFGGSVGGPAGGPIY